MVKHRVEGGHVCELFYLRADHEIAAKPGVVKWLLAEAVPAAEKNVLFTIVNNKGPHAFKKGDAVGAPESYAASMTSVSQRVQNT